MQADKYSASKIEEGINNPVTNLSAVKISSPAVGTGNAYNTLSGDGVVVVQRYEKHVTKVQTGLHLEHFPGNDPEINLPLNCQLQHEF